MLIVIKRTFLTALVVNIFAGVLLLSLSSALADTTWTGATSQDWNDPSNWNNGLPSPTNNATFVNVATGNYPILSSGTISTGQDIRVGTGSNARLDQTGGTLSTGNGNWFYLGYLGATATYNLANTATTGGTDTGFGEGSGSLVLGGTSQNGDLLVGLDNGTVSTVNMNTTGSIVGGNIFLGSNGASSGNFNLDSGTISLSGEMDVGTSLPFNGNGAASNTFNMSGGTVTANIFSVARGGNNTATTVGTVNITGGTLNTKQWFTLGFAGSSSDIATVTNSGGTINVNTSGGGVLEMDVFDQTSSTFNQESGTLTLQNSASIEFGNGGNNSGTATFNQDGGTVTFYGDAGTTVGGTGSINLGNGASTGTYTYNLNGGTLTVPAITKTASGASGTFNFNGGTLKAAASNATFMQGLTAANVRNGGAVFNTNGFNITVGQSLMHSTIGGDNATDGGLSKLGTGNLTLSSSNTYTGATSVTAGGLILGSSADVNSSSGITVNGSGAKFVSDSSTQVNPTVTLTNGTLDGSGHFTAVNVAHNASNVIANGDGTTNPITIDTLSFAGAAKMSLNVGSTSPEVLTTALSTNAAGQIVINASNSGGWSPGTYDLISYGSLTGAGFSEFQKGTIGNLSGRQSATLSNPAGFIALVIAGDNPRWTGALNSNWTTATLASPKNWQLITSGTPTDYISGDVVLFDDTASNFTVNISAANVTPTSTTFTTNIGYVVNGPFGIAGNGSLTKNSGGSLTLNTSNTYSGGTLLNGGTLNINNASAIGTGPLTLASGVTIDNTSGAAITLSTNNAQTWNGDVTFGGTNALNMGTGAISLTASSTVTTNGTANVTLGGGISGTGNITKSGTTTLTLAGTNNYAGALNVNSGTVVLAGSNSYQGITTLNGGTLTVNGSLNNNHQFNFENNAGSIVNVNGTVNVASFDSFGATVNLNSGGSVSVTAGQLSDGSTGNFSSGSLTSSGEFWLGQSGTGTVTQTGGTISSNSWFVIGRAATGVYSISTGALNGATASNNFTMASFFGSSGELDVSGTATVSSGGEFWVGEGGTGLVNQTGGSVSSKSYFVVGRDNDAVGTYNLSAGTVTASTNSGFTTIGSQGGSTGILSVSGGTWNASTGGMIVGEGFGGGNPASGTLNVSGTGLVDLGTNGLQIGANTVASGTVNLDGGTIKAASVFQGTGSGTFNFNGGTLQATASSTSFMTGLSTTNVRDGGAVINTNGQNFMIGQSLQHSNIGGDNAIDGGLTKIGAGNLTLTGSSTYTGSTTASLGTLTLGAAHTIDNTNSVVLAGGKLSTGGFSQFPAAGASTTTLALQTNSHLDLGLGGQVGGGIVSFAASNGLWGSSTLNIDDWTPGIDHLFFGSGSTALDNTQVANITFTDFGAAKILSTGEIVPQVSVPTFVLGDVNGDGHYNAADIKAEMQALTNLSAFENDYGPSHLVLNNDELYAVLDQNHDGLINNADVQALINNLLSGGGSTVAVPEPSAFALLIAGVLGLSSAKQRFKRVSTRSVFNRSLEL